MNKWVQAKLGDIVLSGGGVIQTGPFGSQLHASDYVEEGIPCIMPINLKDNRVNLDAIAHISPADASRLSKHLVQENDIVYGRRGDITKKAFITKNEEGFFCGTGCLLIRPGSKINPKFLLYVLEKPENISWLKNHAVGITMPNLNTNILSSIPLNLPPKNYQDDIATVLGVIDAKIDLNSRINTELEQMVKTLYDYWFVQFDFPDIEGNPYKSSGGKMVYNKELKRKMPESWKIERIDDLGTIVGGSTPSKAIEGNFSQDGVPWITPKDLSMNIGNKFITKGELDVSNKGLKEASLNILPAKSVLMSSRAPVGYLAINRVDCTTNQGFKSIICNKEYSCEYVFYLLKQYMPVIEANATGSTFKEISATVFKSINIIKPNKRVVDEFVKKIKSIFEKQNNLEQQNQQLASLRDWLLPMLMNGQVNVTSSGMSTKENTSMAAEPQTAYEKTAQLTIPTSKKGFAKQVLAGKIVSKFIDDPNFTDIKFQKIQFLAEHIIEADLNLNYYCQAAGPYDNKFMHTIYNEFQKLKWFDFKNKRFIPLEKKEKIEEYYQGYFAPAQNQLNKLFNLLYHSSEAEAEIFATLYAVWNDRIIERRATTDEELMNDFYLWSDRKQRYTKEQVATGVQWLKKYQMEPKGFGKLIKKAKPKS